MSTLAGTRVLVIGRASGIARAVVDAAMADGAHVVVAGRDRAKLADLAARLGHIDHVVTTASARARGRIADLQPETIALSSATKAIGAILLAKHLAPIMPPTGSFVLSSGATALRPSIGMLAVGGTNGAVDSIARGLAVELAPIRVNAVAPGTVDTGAYDALGADVKAELFERRSAGNPAGRVGRATDVAQAVVFALTADFVTGLSIPVDGGELLA
ncbi:MAG TPA: SDR family oxidoreductase [Galbitalea sp.]|jgi:NAD(P)-dependent dehydrogenase (short-subunit alcohol dehydrogenase family)